MSRPSPPAPSGFVNPALPRGTQYLFRPRFRVGLEKWIWYSKCCFLFYELTFDADGFHDDYILNILKCLSFPSFISKILLMTEDLGYPARFWTYPLKAWTHLCDKPLNVMEWQEVTYYASTILDNIYFLFTLRLPFIVNGSWPKNCIYYQIIRSYYEYIIKSCHFIQNSCIPHGCTA